MEEEVKKCNCMEGEECTCGDDCHCGDECECGDECGCGDCHCESFPPLEERLILVGKEGDPETEEAKKYLDGLNAPYKFLDLNDNDELFNSLDFTDSKVPSLLLVQTVVSGVAPGLEGIKDVFEG